MDHKQHTLDELSKKAPEISSKTAMVGFDGFVDRIASVVDTRHGQGDKFKRIEHIDDLGKRISAAAGKSANIEMFVNFEKLGGNGPIMANALLSGGAKTRYIGALGESALHPVFEEFGKNTDAVTIADPGVTHALEFADGKIMMGTMSSLDSINYQSILDSMGEGPFFELMAGLDLISMVNWTMIPNMTELFEDLLDKVLPNLPPRETRHFFFDLADPRKRPGEEIKTCLRTISRFQNHGCVTLGLNLDEANQTYGLLGKEQVEPTPENLKRMAEFIRNELAISCVVVHPKESAACADRNGTYWIAGPYVEKPKITTGAGDHFNAGFSTAQLLGLSPEACLTVGVCFSGHYVRTAESPSLTDIQTFIKNWPN